jgi:hypothetical protein
MLKVVPLVKRPLLAANLKMPELKPRSITELALKVSAPTVSLKPAVLKVPPDSVMGDVSAIRLAAREQQRASADVVLPV